MATNPQLTGAQKYTLRYMGPWEHFSTHSNGDVTVIVGEGIGKQYVRISKEGQIITRKSASGATTSTFQTSLSEELTHAVKQPEKIKKSETYPSKPYVSYSVTVCQDNPACCKPRDVKHVAWDADHTIWNMPGTAAGITGKLKKIDDDTVVELGSPGWGTYEEPEPIYTRQNIEGFLSPEEKELLRGLSADEKDFLLEEMAKEHNEILDEEDKKKPAKGGKESVRTT
ncbi:MAG: hypothetical protein WC455_19620, partial [Dehalococcoidia bacterium]